MKDLVKICFVLVILLGWLISVPATEAQVKPQLWDGTHWKEFSKEIKVAYIKGIGNMADFEVAISGRDKAGCISVGFVDELKGKTIETIINEVDKFYKDNPSKLNTPVIEVVLRQCTALCKPGGGLAVEKK
jgi:hypothetical protein|uniref:Uncharacterized protein n=1 Tax=Desulfobacca acetoxidans TaxID=60893 RepID=A0A7C5AN39_9BACT